MEFYEERPSDMRKKSLIQVQNQKKHSQVAKAAVLSSAMLARKNSSGRGGGPSQFGARESIAAISDMLNTQQKKSARAAYVVNEKLEWAMKAACTISLITVCLHTPKTFDLWRPLTYVVFVLDFLTLVIFVIEAIVRIHQEGFYKYDTSYLGNRWSQFDFFMTVIHFLSWLLHAYQLITIWIPSLRPHYKDWYGVIRSIRPFIIFKLIRLIIRFKLPKNRIEQLLKRSSQQVNNVTQFFIFFMFLYGILGIQLFGKVDTHCVLPTTDPNNVTILDLAVPDTLCSKPGMGGYECPPNLVCMKINLDARGFGFYGMFNDLFASLFTVYLAASEEGWVYVLYDCMDALPSYLSVIYFLSMIFFFAWLVKNVFIAVITETFAEIRVQFSEMWQKSEVTLDDDFRQKIERTDDGWRLVRLDGEAATNGRKQAIQKFLRSMAFQLFMVIFVLVNALINASVVFRHDGYDQSRRNFYYYIEIGFTILFNIECLIKILCYGFRPFISRGIFKFEFLLCIGSSLNTIPYFYQRNWFTYFQTFRVLRLVKASPILEDFAWKIFSPGKKLGSLVVFTIIFMTIASAVSLHLFFCLPHLEYFHTFPQAFMSMFQIITQEGWTDFVVEVLRATNEKFVALAALYFVAYHLFVTLIVLSLFVAVILDNLEMDEELKKVKQLKAREATTSMRSTLPWRLRVFDQFPTRPQMIKMKRVDSDFPLPKIRGSFTHQFSSEVPDTTELIEQDIEPSKRVLRIAASKRKRYREEPIFRHVGGSSLRSSINQLLELSDRTRESVSNSLSFLPHFNRSSTSLRPRKDALPFSKSRNMTGKFAQNTTIRTKMLFNVNENGDLSRPTDSAPKKDQKQGEIDIRALQQKRQLAEITRTRIEEDMRENHPYFDRPLFFVGRASKVREYCKKIVHSKYDTHEENTNGGGAKTKKRFKEIRALIGIMPYLDWGMATITILSCISMLFESPWPTSGENLVMNNFYLQIMDYVFVLAMTFELIVKTVANGLFFTPKAVVRDVGGVMTMFIYFTSLIFLVWMPKTVTINSFAQLLMIFRAMRPLRVYTLVPHIRRVVVEFFRGIKEILLVTMLMIVVMFIFASFGVQIAGGRLAACNDLTVKTRENCTGVFWQKLFVTRLEVHGKNEEHIHPKILVPRVWTNPRNFNFDHVGNAMLALFETLSFKGWNGIRDILWNRHGAWAVVFIHLYVFIGCMIGLTLFVGVVIANYTENRGTALLTVDQRRWHDLKARLKMAQPLHVPPKPSEHAKMRTYLYELTLGRHFNHLFIAFIVINSLTLSVPWHVRENESTWLFASTATSATINILFVVEIILKMIAFTPSGFWQSRRNRVDMLITSLGIIWVVLHFFVALPSSKYAHIASLKRFTYTFGYIIAIMRFFTIASRSSTLKMLMLTVIMSMFRSFFIISALFLLVLFYAYTGVILFGMVKYGMAVNKHVNFRSGKEALVVIFRCITGEDWNDIMHDCMRSAPFCYYYKGINYWETDCGNYYGAIIYFCSFYLIITYIVRNLLVAIIMENFSLFYSSEEDALLSYNDIRNFQLVWNMVDKEQKGSIPVERVKFLLRLLKGRLEVDPEKDRILFKHMCYEMERLHNGDEVSFHDVLYMLSYRSVDIRKSLQLEELLQREELEFIIEEEVAKQTIRTWLEACLRRIRSPPQKDSVVEAGKYSHPHSAGISSLSSHNHDQEMPRFKFGDQESTSSSDEIEEPVPVRKKGIKNRRSSIPDASARAQHMMETVQLLPKRAGSEQRKSPQPRNLHVQLNVYNLPDLEEKSEDGPFSPPSRPLRTSGSDDGRDIMMQGNISPNPTMMIPSPASLPGSGSPRPSFCSPEHSKDVDSWWQILNNVD